MSPANVRLFQQLRADLFRPHQPPSEEVTDLPETVTAVAQITAQEPALDASITHTSAGHHPAAKTDVPTPLRRVTHIQAVA